MRSTPAFSPAPNSEPVGALNGVPPRTVLYRRDITTDAQQIVIGTAENRVVFLTAPRVSYTIWIGDSSVTQKNGVALVGGLTYDVPIIGLQELYAVTDSPVAIPLQIQVAIVLMAERQRVVG